MILAAGRGVRLRPLTDKTPKPLISVGGEASIIRHVRRLSAAGFSPLVINLSHLGEQIRAALGDGTAFGAQIEYSPEPTPLGVAGGIRLAMERGLLPSPFVVVNGDIVCDYDVRGFLSVRQDGLRQDGIHLLLVDTPSEKSSGDFSLDNGVLCPPDDNALTYAGMGIYHPSVFADLSAGDAHEMLPLLKKAINDKKATGEHHRGQWHDIGTETSLAKARHEYDN